MSKETVKKEKKLLKIYSVVWKMKKVYLKISVCSNSE